MNNFWNKLTRAAALAVPLSLLATNVFPDTKSGPDRLAKEVRHELLTLPYYRVFDNLTYSVNDKSVDLRGEVIRPTLKSEAENVVKRIEGVTQVNNGIEVLPLSGFDDRIRLASFRAIYGDAILSTRYGHRAQPPIHIIVKNGHVTLERIVATDFDRNLANLRANGVHGVFSVTDNLRVDSPNSS